MFTNEDETQRNLRSATTGFDYLFSNELHKARQSFAPADSPFHTLGLGACAFLEAALGMETGLMAEAARCLAASEAGARKQLKASKGTRQTTQFPPGTEWDLLLSDAIILQGLNHALSAHSKFSKLFKTVYPHGLGHYPTSAPASPGPVSRTSSVNSASSASSISSASSVITITTSTTTTSTPSTTNSKTSSRVSIFGRFGGSSSSVSTASAAVEAAEGSVDELIMSGTAFGYGLFNLVFSLLPAKIRGVVGFLGFASDRKLALRALAVSAARADVHGVFAGLALMTYHGVVLLLAGYQADEAQIIRQYRAIVDSVSARYPAGSLWILNRAKILRMSFDAEGAIQVLQDGLAPGRPHTFVQADGLLIFELAWTLLSQRRYEEAAEMFLRMTEINSWSHGTYYFIAAGCYVSLRNHKRAQELLDAIPALLEKKKLGGKDLPTEVFIKKKLTFYKEKQKRMTGVEDDFTQCIRISPAEEIGIFWNTHARINRDVALAHIAELGGLAPAPTITSPYVPAATPASVSKPVPDLDTPDELAIRSLLLGINHRTAGALGPARAFLVDAHARQSAVKVSTWVGGVALFELAVLELKEAEARTGAGSAVGSDIEKAEEKDVAANGASEKAMTDSEKREVWAKALREAEGRLEKALALATQQVDLSSRLDSRIAMLRDEIGLKREMLFGSAKA
ncbi:hypothetical protein AcV5_006552 [Taiwanofungus camphoratus]|nr:hypothetical protein AcW2_004992 [Antrodia cinnamomea]KAI0934845.1 hypothetical protein AcV5_006552 [Antrodia cinnamomea]